MGNVKRELGDNARLINKSSKKKKDSRKKQRNVNQAMVLIEQSKLTTPPKSPSHEPTTSEQLNANYLYIDTTSMPFLERMGHSMVDLRIGQQRRHFRVYQRPLCRRIPFFDQLLNRGSVEDPGAYIDLPQFNPNTFDLLLLWAYSGEVERYPMLEQEHASNCEVHKRLMFYALAESLGLPALQDVIMDMARENDRRMNQLGAADYAIAIYNQTGRGSLLRRYAVESVHYWLKLGMPPEAVHEIMKSHGEFAVDLLHLLGRGRKAKDPRQSSSCRYHSHGPDIPCLAHRGRPEVI